MQSHPESNAKTFQVLLTLTMVYSEKGSKSTQEQKESDT